MTSNSKTNADAEKQRQHDEELVREMREKTSQMEQGGHKISKRMAAKFKDPIGFREDGTPFTIEEVRQNEIIIASSIKRRTKKK